MENENQITKNKTQIKNLPILIGASAVGLLVVVLLFVYLPKVHKINQYKESAAEFYSEVLDSGIDMEKVGNAKRNHYDIDDVLREYDRAQFHKDFIERNYKDLQDIPVPDSEELITIRSAIGEVYKAYKEMYSIVIDSSGSYYSFSSDFSRTDSNLSKALKRLDDLVGEYVKE